MNHLLSKPRLSPLRRFLPTALLLASLADAAAGGGIEVVPTFECAGIYILNADISGFGRRGE